MKKNNIFDGTNIYYFILTISVVVSIGLYGKYRCDNIKHHTDVLEFSLYKDSKKYGLDGWSITHFCFNFFIGYFFPKTFTLTILGGIIWELFETYVGIYKPSIIQNYGFCKSLTSDNEDQIWWYGKWSDIIINIIGFLIGKYVSKN